MPTLSDLGSFAQFLTPYPLWLKLSISASVFFAFVSILGLIFAAPAKPADLKPSSLGAATHNVTSNNQSGGTTAHTITIKEVRTDIVKPPNA